jgi:hypothetical protein
MSASTKLVDKFEVVLEKFIKENVPELEEYATKTKYKKDMVRIQKDHCRLH